MKKLYTTEPWKAHSRRRTQRELQARRDWLDYQRWKRRLPKGRTAAVSTRRHHRVRFSIAAPAVFSLIKNPVDTITFLKRLGEVFRMGKDAHVDMSAVDVLTSDAVLVLLSRLTDAHFVRGMRFGGSEPRTQEARTLLHQSGFYEFVRSATLRDPPEGGRIRRKSSLFVEGRVADELIQFATSRMTGRHGTRRAAYLSLVECMSNTHDHSAKDTPAVNQWWANVYCPPGGERSYFTIVGNGVGIFNSMTVRQFRRALQRSVGVSGNAQMFRDWMAGRLEVPSRTGERNRGKGILAMYDRMKHRRDGMENLIIIANDVYAHLGEGRIESMPAAFRGTFVYWEINA